MAAFDPILKYLPRLLPEIKVSPLPEVIFLSTIKALFIPAAGLSLYQWGIIGSLVLLTNVSPALRKATLKLYGYLSLIIGTEIALINAYVLICSWISPSTTLEPLTVTSLNVLNSLVPVYTDSLVLFHLVKEKASRSDSKLRLVSSLGTPILLKFIRLANSVVYIQTNAEFILTSFGIANDGGNLDTAIEDMARMWNVYISSSLHIVDNLYSLYVHWTHTIEMWEARRLARTAHPEEDHLEHRLVWSLGLHYILPIILSAAQLAMPSYVPVSGNTAMLIDAAKVMINLASTRMTTLHTTNIIDLVTSSASLVKAEELARDMLKAVPAPQRPVPDDAIKEIASGGMTTSGRATGSVKDSIPKTPQLNPEHQLSPQFGSS